MCRPLVQADVTPNIIIAMSALADVIIQSLLTSLPCHLLTSTLVSCLRHPTDIITVDRRY